MASIARTPDPAKLNRATRSAHPRRHHPGRWSPLLVVVLAALCVLLTGLLASCGVAGTTTTAGPAAPKAPTRPLVALQVTSVTMAVTPASLAGLACGTTLTETYAATIHVTPKNPGGTVQFSYTVNNGRGQTPASITFSPGQTTKTYAFTWSGALPADHTAPGLGGIQVTSPNQLTSPLIAPTGPCTPVAAPACGSNFNGSGSQSYQNSLMTPFGTVPLPPLSRTVADDASGGVRGYDICSAGTAATITAFMQQNLPASSSGIINWSVADPLDWNINWRIPACGSNFNGSESQSYQSSLTTDFGTVPLPPLSRTVPNDASGGVRGYDICSTGTVSMITTFMQQNLPAYGWMLVSNSGGIQSWKSSSGTINWSVADPLEWNINWRLPLS
ncbi:MAG: hypothetical protein ACLQUY_05810 [Ktedonobacterales bacterium]